MNDLYYYHRVGCCILNAAIDVLSKAGLPIPARRDQVYSGKFGDPTCCDALLVTLGNSRPNPRARTPRCGPLDKITEWEVRIFRDACPVDPECDANPVDCRDLVLCPTAPWPEPPELDPCAPASRAYQQALIYADRAALEQGLSAAIDACLCDREQFDCDEPCLYDCSDPTIWTSTTRATGGGCAGSILKFETHTIGK